MTFDPREKHPHPDDAPHGCCGLALVVDAGSLPACESAARCGLLQRTVETARRKDEDLKALSEEVATLRKEIKDLKRRLG